MQRLTSIKMADPAAAPSPTPNPGSLAERLEQIHTSSPTPMSRTPSVPGTPTSVAAGVLDNGTNIGSVMGRKASIGAGNKQSFSMERRSSQSGSGRVSRRGSGMVITPSGTSAVYHTRTHVSFQVDTIVGRNADEGEIGGCGIPTC